MPKLVTWMNNQRVGELTKLANGAHTFKPSGRAPIRAPEKLPTSYVKTVINGVAKQISLCRMRL